MSNLYEGLVNDDEASLDEHTWPFVYEDELEAIRRFHEKKAADELFTGHHLICYNSERRLCRIGVRPFSEYDEKYNAFANLFMQIPVFAPEGILFFSDVWVRPVDMEDALSENHPDSPNFLMPSQYPDKIEAITVVALDKQGYQVVLYPYSRDGTTIIWQDTDKYSGSFTAHQTTIEGRPRIESMVAESYLIRQMRDAILTPKPEGVSETTSYWLLTNQGYEVVQYQE